MKKFDNVYDEYSNKVFKYLVGLTRDELLAEELTQEVFYRAFIHIDRFKGESSLYTWLCKIGKNLYFDQINKGKYVVDEADLSQISTESFESALCDKAQSAVIHKILHNLQEPYKEVFSLKVFGELKYKEIGEIFGKTESWAKVTFYRAKIMILERLEEKDNG